jgi:putative transposase
MAFTASARNINEKNRQIGLSRHALLLALAAYREANPGMKAEAADLDFLAGYNSGAVHQHIYKVLGEVSRPTLYRWKAELGDKNDWTRLVPQYNRQETARLNPMEQQVYLALLLTPNKLSIGKATEFAKLILRQRGHPADKSDMTFRRFADDFAARNFDVWTLMREGQKALKDKVEPYIKRDPTLLQVGDVLVADGHRLNFQIVNPYTGKPCRATLVGYVDWKSYDLAGYEIMVNENTQCIASAMRNALIRLGAICRVAYQDNGKAFRARFFTGSPSFEEAGFYGLFGRLGIVPVFAAPYNARAKIIERWFKEFTASFEKLFPSYIGSSIAEKPAYMMRNEKLHKALHNEYVPTLEETMHLLDLWLGYYRGRECPHAKGQSIGQCFESGMGSGVDVAQLDDLMMETVITRIDRNGIRFLTQDYYNENLHGLREKVVIKYSLFDLKSIKVFAMNGEHICTAERVMAVHPMARVLGTADDVSEVKRQIAQQRSASKKTLSGFRELAAIGQTVKVDWSRVPDHAARIAGQCEREGIELQAENKSIPDEACGNVELLNCGTGNDEENGPAEIARLEPVTRPFFANGIDRYQWHLQHGVLTEEDEAWCVWFRTTGDFKLLFQAMDAKAEGQ